MSKSQAKIEYAVDDALQRAVDEALANKDYSELTALREAKVTIATCMCVRVDKDGETQPCKGPVITLKKVPPHSQVYIKSPYIVVVDYGWWNEANAAEQEEGLFNALYSIEVEDVGSDAGPKFGLREHGFKIIAHPATVKRFGLKEGDGQREVVQEMISLSRAIADKALATYEKE